MPQVPDPAAAASDAAAGTAGTAQTSATAANAQTSQTAAQASEGAPDTGLRTPPERALTRDRRRHVDGEPVMRIGEVADRLGLSLRSIRHYEECGLVTPTARTNGGFRLYAEGDVQRLLLIMQMKPLGFALDEMRQVLDDLDVVGGAARPGDAAAEEAARERLGAVREDVEGRWHSLRQRLEIAGMFREHLAEELHASLPTD